MIRNSGYCAIGFWKDNYTLHGYAKRMDKDRNITMGLFEEAKWHSGKPKSKDQITQYDPDHDEIAEKIEFDDIVKGIDHAFVDKNIKLSDKKKEDLETRELQRLAREKDLVSKVNDEVLGGRIKCTFEVFDELAKKDSDVERNIQTLLALFVKHGVLNIKQLVRDGLMTINFDENNRVLPIKMYMIDQR